MLLDRALKDHILSDSTPNSSRLRLGGVVEKYIDQEYKHYPTKDKDELRKSIL
ncbi:hypothetical protein R515_17290 [Salmonella enterica subsp. arizonae serovar 41:z4,z23:-]|uniref:DUF3289 family protein n=1 Tax=Salmonella enterica TaxID=28901 RepID=A0A5U1Q577_SALER|nr:DUF3289 family protein [Salmonella enterica]MIH91969.1 DUF3289 family protein [Salmonella enterica subsp. arizonae]OSE56191.1 hypothetical protein R515_17290 [Salmonella enterica subsp. arizonae serovar 41:z4,z23:-]EBI4019445.1 DUF3289 family protein [Salmonella enterica]EBL0526599.1 DUF3289 family protein [Salmonella enterica]